MTLSPAEREELVAYLDGELPPELSRRIEDRLATDESYRGELRALDQAWRALDNLPQATANDAFARTTLEMVAISAEKDLASQSAALPTLRRRRTALWLVGCALATVTGFGATRILAPNPNRELIHELPVIAQVDLYAQLDDLEFLRQLSGPSRPWMRDQAREAAPAISTFHAIVQASPNARRRHIQQMTPDEQSQLSAKARQFAGMSAEERERIRALHETVLQAADKESIVSTMLVYGQWLATRSAGEQAQLREASLAERMQLMRRWARDDRIKEVTTLSPEDAHVLREAVLQVVRQHQDDWKPWLQRQRALQPTGPTADIDLETELRRPRPVLAMLALRALFEKREIRTQFVEQLTARLSVQAQQKLKSTTPERRFMLLTGWVKQVFRGQQSTAALESFFESELSNDVREKILSLPPDQWEEELERMYFAQRMGRADGPMRADRRTRLRTDRPPTGGNPGGPGRRPVRDVSPRRRLQVPPSQDAAARDSRP